MKDKQQIYGQYYAAGKQHDDEFLTKLLPQTPISNGYLWTKPWLVGV